MNYIFYNFLKNKCNTYVLLNAAFYAMDSLISIPFFAFKPKFLNIELFFFWKPFDSNIFNSILFSKFAELFKDKLEYLIYLIAKLLKTNTHLQAIRVFYPYNDCNIFSFFLGSLSYVISYNRLTRSVFKKLNMRFGIRRIFRLKYRNIPSLITGMEIKFAGRILSSKAKKRVKDQNTILGSLARQDSYLKTSSNFSSKTKGGAFNIAITQKNTFVNY